jgi:hypothetical protein
MSDDAVVAAASVVELLVGREREHSHAVSPRECARMYGIDSVGGLVNGHATVMEETSGKVCNAKGELFECRENNEECGDHKGRINYYYHVLYNSRRRGTAWDGTAPVC